MIYPQFLLDLHDELIVDLFAGGGGASTGIEAALGRQVDIAINHDAEAVAMHRANHPQTEHYQSDVFEVCPRDVTKGRAVGLLWASPDCVFHSKARGGKPIRDSQKKRRALAWVVTRWAGQVRPRVIMLENVEEFQDWGPLVAKRDKKTGRVKTGIGVAAPGQHTTLCDQQLIPNAMRKGATFRQWVNSLERMDYAVEWRELRGCDYGAPTIRKRLFVIARCDGYPIVWPSPTHGDPDSEAVKKGRIQPYRTAAECIDWSEPMCSIFATPDEAKTWGKQHGRHRPKRPLADNTMKRIARGVMKYVVENPEPFILTLAHGESRWGSGVRKMDEPLHTQTTENRHALVAAHIQRDFGQSIGSGADEPVGTITTNGGGKAALVATFLSQNNSDRTPKAGRPMDEPVSTILKSGSHQSLVAANLVKMRGTNTGQMADEPLHTVSAGGQHHGIVAAHLSHNYTSNTVGGEGDLKKPIKTIATGGHAMLIASWLMKYYGAGVGQNADEPAHSITTVDRFGLVTVQIDGQSFVVVDICLRMLQPLELYRAQGFHDGYIIQWGIDENGHRIEFTKTAQVWMVGNSVCPPIAAALARANVPQMILSRAA